MTVKEECTMYCAICGGPIDELYANTESDWLSRAILLHQPESSEPSSAPILEIPARNIGGPYFAVRSTGQSITACDYADFMDDEKPLYIPLHEACLTLTKRFISSSTADKTNKDKSNQGHNLSSGMQHVWCLLHTRFDDFAAPGSGPLTNIGLVNDHDDMWRFQELVWEPSNDAERRFESQHFEADPLRIPDMTSSILRNLHSLPIPSPLSSGEKSTSAPLPPELAVQVAAELVPFTAPSLTCTYLLAPKLWKSAILSGALLPWLWDLDIKAVEAKEAAEPREGWDWELLARQLAQVEIHKPRRVLPNLMMGLRNRRRIWRLIGDVVDTRIINRDGTSLPAEI
ncbi:MAG: hypothetical protein Q9225_005348 [Loekoesia sp. 1 TL-2023]